MNIAGDLWLFVVWAFILICFVFQAVNERSKKVEIKSTMAMLCSYFKNKFNKLPEVIRRCQKISFMLDGAVHF